MTNEYHKIQSIYKRHPDGSFRVGEWSTPALSALRGARWVWTEKIDGTNIRLSNSPDGRLVVQGRTDRAQIPATLISAIGTLGLDGRLGNLVLYGEGFGAKIQKGGGNYRPDQGFVLFDVFVPDESHPMGGWWLEREQVDSVASQLGIEVAPVVGAGTLDEAIRFVAERFPHSRWGAFRPEGIVCRIDGDAFDRAGKRVICKVKHKDLIRCGLAQ